MPAFAPAALTYFAAVFAVAFALGVLRVLVVIPLTGPLIAVALEVPVILALAWWVAGLALMRWPMPLPDRLAMGALAFGLLMLAELALATAFGQTPGQFIAATATPAGALGLAGQIGFALIPALRPYPRG
jgi:hypothetical protein